MTKPSIAQIKTFYETAFKRKWNVDPVYFNEWVERFESPRRVWSFSDYDRRKLLKKSFPKKFGMLDKDANLNNPNYQIKEYDEW